MLYNNQNRNPRKLGVEISAPKGFDIHHGGISELSDILASLCSDYSDALPDNGHFMFVLKWECRELLVYIYGEPGMIDARFVVNGYGVVNRVIRHLENQIELIRQGEEAMTWPPARRPAPERKAAARR